MLLGVYMDIIDKINKLLSLTEEGEGITASGNVPSSDVSGGTSTENIAVVKNRMDLSVKRNISDNLKNNVDLKDLKKGTSIELKKTKNKKEAKEIALNNLLKNPNFYK